MDKETQELYQVNDDIVFILNTGLKIGWKEIKRQSINRIIYLSKVLYSFVNQSELNMMGYYHFTAKNMPGPMSSIINNSLVDLESREFIINSNSGIKLNIFGEQLANILDASLNPIKQNKQKWLKIIMLLLGKYGENKVFSFTINDPLYIEKIESNSSKEITFEVNENKTLKVLNNFKNAFEESIEDTSSISKEEYLELYFDYIFSQIIK